MVDANARVASVRIAEVVPEDVDRFFGMEMPDAIRPSLGQQLLIGGPRLWEEERVLDPALTMLPTRGASVNSESSISLP